MMPYCKIIPQDLLQLVMITREEKSQKVNRADAGNTVRCRTYAAQKPVR